MRFTAKYSYRLSSGVTILGTLASIHEKIRDSNCSQQNILP